MGALAPSFSLAPFPRSVGRSVGRADAWKSYAAGPGGGAAALNAYGGSRLVTAAVKQDFLRGGGGRAGQQQQQQHAQGRYGGGGGGADVHFNNARLPEGPGAPADAGGAGGDARASLSASASPLGGAGGGPDAGAGATGSAGVHVAVTPNVVGALQPRRAPSLTSPRETYGSKIGSIASSQEQARQAAAAMAAAAAAAASGGAGGSLPDANVRLSQLVHEIEFKEGEAAAWRVLFEEERHKTNELKRQIELLRSWSTVKSLRRVSSAGPQSGARKRSPSPATAATAQKNPVPPIASHHSINAAGVRVRSVNRRTPLTAWDLNHLTLRGVHVTPLMADLLARGHISAQPQGTGSGLGPHLVRAAPHVSHGLLGGSSAAAGLGWPDSLSSLSSLPLRSARAGAGAALPPTVAAAAVPGTERPWAVGSGLEHLLGSLHHRYALGDRANAIAAVTAAATAADANAQV